MQHQAKGTFDVKMVPQADDTADVGRMTLDKTFHGDLEASSIGQMIAVRTPTEGSAGYVAMERVTGTLGGKKGSFALQHFGTMNRGKQHLRIEIVPDSGTDGLAGISGTLDIIIEKGAHSYVLDYTLPG
ncbi:DUF3224 domain-containing protein [Sphingorhabdus lacus]|uniref:DUF3224 domain-containing protein n=1 Tax=Sphingorhabdus lacus TaxID=392610 RepID=A0A6I6LCX4_9SPHN|nr:DUF3224 domain-containing protein [Sphingorhabdus lacus]